MGYPILAANSTWYKGSAAINTITEINIVDTYVVTGNETESWNADVDNSGAIKCYITGTVLTMAGNGSGKIAMNADSCNVFMNFQNLTNIVGTNILDTSSATTFERMFQACFALQNLDANSWDTGNVTTIKCMFQGAKSLASLNIGNWDTSSVVDMTAAFKMPGGYRNEVLTVLDISDWDVSSCTDMSNMFNGLIALTTLDISNWDTSSVTSMADMFASLTALTTLDISNWDTSSVTSMLRMFCGCTSLEALDISNWDVSNVTDMRAMFQGNSTNAYDMKLKSLDVSKWTTTSLTTAGWMFYGCAQLTTLDLSSWDVSKVTSTEHMFADCLRLENINFSGWSTASLTNTNAMFNDCRALTSIDLSMFDTSKVTNFPQMFENCVNLTEIVGIDSWDTSSAYNFGQIFQGCKKLKVLDLSNWNVENAMYFNHMFTNSGLERINLSGWSPKNLTTFAYTFLDCTALVELNLSNCNIAIKYFNKTFKNCSALETLDLSGFDVSYSVAMQDLFSGMIKLKKVIFNEKFAFDGCGTLDAAYGTEAAILPTPDPSLIQGADGYWYNAETAAIYASTDIPSNVAATYLAVPSELTCATLIKYGTLVRLADAIRASNGSSVKYTPEEMIMAITEFILISTTEGSTKRFKLTVDDEGVLTTTEIVESEA